MVSMSKHTYLRGDRTETGKARVLARMVAHADSNLSVPRVLAVLAHPDDEVLAIGGRMERFRGSTLLCVTDGAAPDGMDSRAHGFRTREEYARTRRSELEAAMRMSGLPADCARPVMLLSPGGAEAIADQTAAFHLIRLARELARQIELCQPEAVLTHSYEGGHPDHDSCAFAVHAAMRLLCGDIRPVLIEAPFYHMGENGIETGSFLGGHAGGVPFVCELSAREQVRKRERLGCFVTQRETLAQFEVEREQFRLAPGYDFLRPPHPGRLFYENFSWGMTGDRFCVLAGKALQDLGLATAEGRAA